MTKQPAQQAIWRAHLSGDDVADVRALVADATKRDGIAPLSGHLLDQLETGEDQYLLQRNNSGGLDGVAVVHDGDPGEVAVAVESRGNGIGTELVQQTLQCAGAVWAHGSLPAADAVARRLGLRRTRELLQMRRSLPFAVGTPVPQGVRLRTFVPGVDDEAFLAVNARAFSWHPEQGRLDLAGLRAEVAQGWFDPAGFFLAVNETVGDEAGALLGFHWTKVHDVDPTPGDAITGDEPAGPIGEVYVIGVDPRSPIRGLGAPLTDAGLEYLAAQGLSTVMLYVEGDNEPALALYRRFGFGVHLRDVVFRAD